MKSNQKPARRSILRKTLPFLKIVSRLPKKSRKQILRATNGDHDILKSLREIGINSKMGNLKVSKKLLSRQIPYINKLIKTNPKKCTCAKRKKLVQKGDGLLALAIPALSALASTLFSK